jgi:two-component system KDP operon response regulator KdpE
MFNWLVLPRIRMEPKTRILVVDDNADLCASLRLVLKHSGFQVETASSGPTALRMVRASPPDVVILDANMRPVSGFETLAQIRAESNVPIIFLTVRDTVSDKANALDQGADDYVTKPYHKDELLARIRSVLRRSDGTLAPPVRMVSVGWIQIDLDNARVKVDGSYVELPMQEWRILSALAHQLGDYVTSAKLKQAAWFDEPIQARHQKRLKVEINRLRTRLNDTARPPQLIHAKYNAGYCLEYRPRTHSKGRPRP